jgi:NAD(P)-dependent dehydrogenase (short-subunit alcohol dehydrogenase family)
VSSQAGEAPRSRRPAELFDLSGRVALVTGGSRGLGREIVLGLAAAGADVIVVSRKLAACETVAAEARAFGVRALAVAAHVGHWEQLTALADTAYAEFGRVDVLVNNAGMSPVYPDLVAIDEALWDKVQDVNLKGPFRLTALVGTRMAAAGRGSIINVSSASATHPRPTELPYAAAKAGVNALTIGFAHAFGPGVRVNCVSPGTFLTDISTHWDMDAFAQVSGRFALRRGAAPQEIVGSVLYLASDASSFTTGAILDVDGGFA